MSRLPPSPDGRPNRIIVAVVAPFYLAWLAIRGAILAVARGLDGAVAGILAGIWWIRRPFAAVLRGMARGLGAVGRGIDLLLAPVGRAIDRGIRGLAAAIAAARGELLHVL